MLEVAILSYNRPTQLSRVLASLPVGFEQDSLFTIYDDNSPSRDLISEVYDHYKLSLSNLRLVIRDKNLGYDQNLYTALSQSSANYILFISDDDYFNTDSLSTIINLSKSFTSSMYIFPYTYRGVLYRSFKEHSPSDASSLIYNSILFSGLCFNVHDLLEIPLIETMYRSVFIQIYMALYCFSRMSFTYLDLPLILLGSDGENFFGSSSALKDDKLLNRGSSISDFNYQKRLISVVDSADQNLYSGVLNIFLREYNKRLIGLLLRARFELSASKYFTVTRDYIMQAPLILQIARAIILFLPGSLSLRIYKFLRNFRYSG